MHLVKQNYWSKILSSLTSNLIRKQHTGNGVPIRQHTLGVHVFLPLYRVLKGIPIGQVKHDNAAVSVFVINSSHPRKPFLTLTNEMVCFYIFNFSHNMCTVMRNGMVWMKVNGYQQCPTVVVLSFGFPTT